MKKNFLLRCSCFFAILSSSVFGGLSSGQHIVNTVNKLVAYHVDVQEMNQDILTKSLRTYIHSFDLFKSYLLEKEASKFINPTDSFKKNLLEEYKNNDFSSYQEINKIIKESIPRARLWRESWMKNAQKFFDESSHVTPSSNKTTFTNNLSELERRHREYFLALVASYVKDAPKNKYLGKEEALLKLCHNSLKSHENDYLCLKDNGKPMNKEEGERHLSIKIIKSIAHSLDAHTAYFSEAEAVAIKTQLEKGMCGIGILLKEDVEGVVIKDIIPGGPAHESKQIFPEDIIKTVNGQSIKNMSFNKVLELLKGTAGSKVSLGIERSSTKKKVDVSIIRNRITLEDKRLDMNYEPFGDGIIGKLTLHSFYEGENNISSERDLKNAISSLQKHNMLGLILDMRENSGGFLSQAVKVSGLFMSNGIVVVSKYGDGSVKYYRTFNSRKFYDGPLVILVSKNTASASEIVAQTLQDYGLAVIVGDEQTYGKGTIQHQTITGKEQDEPLFKVTVGRYYTASGKSTQIEGVKSDIIVNSKYSEEEIGERYLENPLPSDSYRTVIEDNLEDVPGVSKKWFQKYYLPSIQLPENKWKIHLPRLVQNSRNRIEDNNNYQKFQLTLKQITKEKNLPIDHSFGSNDLQMEESINIIKDMIFLSSQTKQRESVLLPGNP